MVPEEVRGQIRSVDVYDPSAGSGTLLMNVAHAIGEDKCMIYTQDISQNRPIFAAESDLNNLVHSLNNVVQGNTICRPPTKTLQAV
ncbi:Type I restriction-modification system DNA methylase [Neisseria gonorrhoeae]|uniref:Type I restriction-modification system DNA methylase n=1 Tax=Neisseria gonorrhoeae TaxID=485 RepID=A0A378VX67_NEIGO|nr:Type I restriction-modification system DNA methylase [Neisseria gonorrhoeae]